MTGFQGCRDAGRRFGLDHDDAAVSGHRSAESLGQRRRQPADACLHEEVRRPFVQGRELGNHFPGHEPVPGQNVRDDGIILCRGCIRNQQTLAPLRSPRRCLDRIIIGAWDPDDLCPLSAIRLAREGGTLFGR